MSRRIRRWLLPMIAMTLAAPARAVDVDPARARVEFETIPLDLRLGGRLHLDFGDVDEDRTTGSESFEIRRSRLYLRGKAFEDWRFKVEYDFASGGLGLKNVWLQYGITEDVSLRMGNFVAPFGLEDVAASNHATFLERALSSAFAPSFQTGVGLRARGSARHRFGRARWTASAGGFVAPFADDELDRHRSDHRGFVSRLTLAPFSERRRLLHLGLSLEYRDVGSDGRHRIRTRPESSLAPALYSTGTLGDVADVLSFGVETATVLGPFSAQFEYMRSMLDRSGRSDPAFDGWYLQGSWILSGEARRYGRSTGTFRGVKPERRLGAVEVALRYSAIDLVDRDVLGGEGSHWTVGLNWYLRRNVRLAFNYVRVDSEQRRTGLEDEPEILQARFLVFF